MSEWENYCKILQVDPLAEPEVIEAAYKKLAQKYHPDVNKSPQATLKMKQINNAHDFLTNVENKQAYDRERLERQKRKYNQQPHTPKPHSSDYKAPPKPNAPIPPYKKPLSASVSLRLVMVSIFALAIVVLLVIHFWPSDTPTNTSASPNFASSTPISTKNVVSSTPIITTVSNISSDWTQTITIQGQGFGNLKPYNGNSPYIKITNVTQGWDAGHDANWITLNVSQWTDVNITISGFTGLYGGPYRQLLVGDKLQINVWNAQSGSGPASYTLICGSS